MHVQKHFGWYAVCSGYFIIIVVIVFVVVAAAIAGIYGRHSELRIDHSHIHSYGAYQV